MNTNFKGAGNGGKKNNPLSVAVQERDRNTIDLVRDALENSRAMLAYQPIVQARPPNQIAYYEGLIRIMDRTGRIIPAREFIDEVETTELGRKIDCIALKQGLQTLKLIPDLRLSINMSARSIGYQRWMRILNRGLKADPSVAERLILEITERSAMTVPDIVQAFMADLQTRGITFALDDFGAGFTSFRYLKDFYFDVLKIDGQFIRGIHANPDNQVLTQALISIGTHFEMFTVAEMVESESDARFLMDLGIDCMQGYYFGVPTVRPLWLVDAENAKRRA
ncbi:MAG: EAL domain-containing protein [Marinosulfonomonas sp.]|nr:EAL domain-containing protein [Marinosulfonomonas sp.]